MGVIGEIIESIIDSGLRVVKILKLGEKDNSNSYQVSSFGEDSKAPEGYSCLYIKTSNSEEPVCVGYINKVVISALNAGEKQIFSTNEAGDAIAAYIRLLNDGKINFNGDADFIAGFNDLKVGFDESIFDLNKTITKLNRIIRDFANWVVIPNDGGAALKALVGAILEVDESVASIDDSKKDNLKTE